MSARFRLTNYAATRQFGNSVRFRGRSHEAIEFEFETALQHLKYSLRQMRKNSVFAVTAILVLSLGIGAASIFTFLDAVLIRPLPYQDPNHLADVPESGAMTPRANLSYFDYLDWKRLNKALRME